MTLTLGVTLPCRPYKPWQATPPLLLFARASPTSQLFTTLVRDVLAVQILEFHPKAAQDLPSSTGHRQSLVLGWWTLLHWICSRQG